VRRGFQVGLVLAVVPGAVAAQLCRPGPSSNEARTFAIVSTPLVFTGAGAAGATHRRLEVGLEAVYLPRVDAATRTPTTCRPGKGPENANLLTIAPRPRVALFPGAGLMLEASWIPPVRLNGVKPDLVGLALAWTGGLGRDDARLTLRGHATLGRIRAPITCPDAALQDPTSEYYQGRRSDDRFDPDVFGVEAQVAWSLGDGLVQPYLGTGYNRLQPRFQVNFTNAVDLTDNQKVEVDLNRVALFGGVTWRAAGAVTVSGEVYAMPSDTITGRLVIRAGLGGR
jgi:hypothetical protein